MDIMKKIKEMLESQNRNKLIENTVIVIIIGIILIIAGSTIFSGSDKKNRQEEAKKYTASQEENKNASSELDETEKKLKSILSQIQGVGKIDVMITYATTRENVPAYDIKKSQSKTLEKDSEGGTRDTSQEEYDSTIAYEDSENGGREPVIIKELQPEIKGVLVVAEGADRIEVRERICYSVMVLFDIPAHKVHVVQRKK